MRISDWSSDVCSSDLVFTDVVMPGMTGLELASKLKQQNPRLPIILTTGYSDRIVSAGSEGYPVLPKPYRLETRSEEHTSEPQSLMRISYAVFCLKKKNTHRRHQTINDP